MSDETPFPDPQHAQRPEDISLSETAALGVDLSADIPAHLSQLCREAGVKLLYGCESGSRAWDMASPDSDWDIRFLYVHPLSAYLRLEDPPESLSLMDGLLDYGGWDLRKALGLLRQSNAAVFEWLNSPIVYQAPDEVIQQLQALAPDYFSPRKVAHHYLGLTRKYLPRLEVETPRLKDFFYAVRALLSAQWVLTRESPPPLPVPQLLSLIGEPDFEAALGELLSAKRQATEQAVCPVPAIVLHWLRGQFRSLETHADGLPLREGEPAILDAMFQAALGSPDLP